MQFLENIPQPLYKYRNWEEPDPNKFSRKILTENEVFLSSANRFNDPFENSYPYRYKEEDLTPENIFKKLWDVGKRTWPEISDSELHDKCFERQNSGAFENGEYWKEWYSQFKKEGDELYGILSMSSKKDNLLMWSHYTNSHKGFCVGIDKFALWESIQGSIGPVIYDAEFPKIGIFDEVTEVMTRILSTKSLDWKYEDEYRYIKFNSANVAYKFPNEAVHEIILGHNMPEQHKDEIMAIANVKFKAAKIFQSHINLEKFKLDMIPIFR